MPATSAYHIYVAPSGYWQLRVFNLPPTGCPWLAELLASPLGDRAAYRKGVDGQHSVVRLEGTAKAELTWLQKRLAAHGILPARRPAT